MLNLVLMPAMTASRLAGADQPGSMTGQPPKLPMARRSGASPISTIRVMLTQDR